MIFITIIAMVVIGFMTVLMGIYLISKHDITFMFLFYALVFWVSTLLLSLQSTTLLCLIPNALFAIGCSILAIISFMWRQK